MCIRDRSYIDRVVSTGQYAFPPDVFCDNMTYDRMYDELVMYGKAQSVSLEDIVEAMNPEEEEC